MCFFLTSIFRLRSIIRKFAGSHGVVTGSDPLEGELSSLLVGEAAELVSVGITLLEESEQGQLISNLAKSLHDPVRNFLELSTLSNSFLTELM